jgi:hypothetical protein
MSAEAEPSAPSELSSRTVLRRSQDRPDDRDGIPMVLALVSEVATMSEVGDQATRSDGARIAQTMERLRADLAPLSRDDDMGVLISVLRAASYVDMELA